MMKTQYAETLAQLGLSRIRYDDLYYLITSHWLRWIRLDRKQRVLRWNSRADM